MESLSGKTTLVTGGTVGLSTYNASKFAVAGLSRSWAKDLGPRNFLVNDVQPGPVNAETNPEDGPNSDFMRGNTPSVAKATRTRSPPWSPFWPDRTHPTSPARPSSSTAAGMLKVLHR